MVSSSAIITHTQSIEIDGAAVQSLAIARVVQLDPVDEFPTNRYINELITFARTSEIR
jgi:ADP-ribosylglycohydrolase